MSLFELNESRCDEGLASSSDAATRALSVAVVKNDFVEKVYANLASVYDWTFGPTLHAGRLEAIRRLPIRPGDDILEVGIGTGINAELYPPKCSVTGIDFSPKMLQRAERRINRRQIRNVRLLKMDAANLEFQDESFDIVYAPYLISVVSDPVRVAREMHRVCRLGGHIIVLNHFRSDNPLAARAERLISPLTVHIGFKADLDLAAFLVQAELEPISIEKVNIPRVWSLIICRKDRRSS